MQNKFWFCHLFQLHRYSSFAAYGQSKLANVLHTNELARLLKVCDLFHGIENFIISKIAGDWTFFNQL